jgi:antitoxin component YwqK of YwqJK toxin-antitoxin module
MCIITRGHKFKYFKINEKIEGEYRDYNQETFYMTDKYYYINNYLNNKCIMYDELYNNIIRLISITFYINQIKVKSINYYGKDTYDVFNYKNGILDGEQKEYYSDGTLNRLYYCRYGIIIGEDKSYSSSGKLYSITDWFNDDKYKLTMFDNNGKIIKTLYGKAGGIITNKPYDGYDEHRCIV